MDNNTMDELEKALKILVEKLDTSEGASDTKTEDMKEGETEMCDCECCKENKCTSCKE